MAYSDHRMKNDTFQECIETNKKQQSEIHDLRERLERLEESCQGHMDPHKRLFGNYTCILSFTLPIYANSVALSDG